MKIGFDDCMKIITKRMSKGELCLTNKNQKCTGHPLNECLPCIQEIIKDEYKVLKEKK